MNSDHISVWEACLKIIRDNISHQSFKTWFLPIKPVRLEDSVLTIEVPSQFFYEWLEENYITLLKKTIRKELGVRGRLEYSIVMESSPGNSPSYTINVPSSQKQAVQNKPIPIPVDINRGNAKEIPNPFVIPGLRKVKVHSQLVDSLSFDNFIEGDCNRLARAAGYAVAANPGKTSFNPIFIYSNVGLGKTHLAHAIGIQVKNNFPDKTVLYLSAEQFVQQFIDATMNGNQNDFVHFYQMMDVLILDDIHFLAGKTKTQDIFFHIFNYLHQKSKQIVITSDKPPVELKDLEARLLSRFKWGLTADLQVPNYETRIAILQKRLHNDGITMPQEIINYIAKSVTSNIRELEGALISLIAQSSLNKKDITIDLAKQVIANFIKNTTKEISIETIQKVVCEFFNIPQDVINSKTRKREIVQARQLTMFFAKKHTRASLSNIGLRCGNKDHATVLYACRTITNLIETDKKFRGYVEEIDTRLKI